MAIKLLSPTRIGNFTLPHNDGTNGQALVTDGNGNISFAHTGSLSGLSFSSGTLTASTATGNITVNLDGRYALSSHTHAYDNYQSWNLKTNGVQRTTVQSGGTLDLVAGSNVTLSYGAGGVVTIAAASSTETDTLATVTARGATTSTPVTFNGNVTLGNSADLVFKDLAGTFPTSGKGFDWELNNDGARIYAIQPSSDSIDLVFQLRDNATTNDRFVWHVKDYQGAAFDKYPLIIRGGTEFDLVDSGLFVRGTQVITNGRVLQNVSGNISLFTNDSGYITGSGSTSGNAGTATRLATARTLTIGSTGKTFDGSANVSWTLAEIGAQAAGSYAAASHTHVWTDITNRPTNVSSFTNDSGYITSSGSTSGYSGTLIAEDNRTIAPSELSANRLKFGFTSWGNNNTTPYADFLHLRSYQDASGGNDNLVMFRKDTIGMRIYQQAWGSTTAYSTYKDVAFTDGTNSSGTWGISITGSAGSVAWANITGTPSTFTPSSHTHAIADVTGLQTALDGKQAAGSYAAASHTHDDRYYTETEVGNFFGGTTAITGYNKSNWDTAFGWGNHASQSYATQTYVNTAVANVVNSAPAALDTLRELATALGNDASFSTTVSTALGNRLRIDTNAQGLTATQQGYGRTNLGLGTAATSNTGDFATSGHTHSAATTGAAGFMSAADKTKLDGISSGATANAGTVTSVSGTGSYGGLTLSGTVTSSGSLTLGGTPTGTWPISISGSADTVDGYHASGLWKLNEWNGSILGHTDGRIYGTIFYDSNDSAYYADPASTSNLNGVSARQYYQSLHGEPRNNLGDPTITDMALFDAQFNNKTELYAASKIKFFTSSDGTNYSEYTGFSDVQKQRLVTGDDNSGVFIPNGTNRFRIELDARGYVAVSMLYMYWSSNSHSSKVHIWFRRSDNQTWYQHTNSSTNVSSWPGHITLPFPSLWWLEGGNSSGHCDKIRIEFIPNWSGHPDYGTLPISLDRLQLWGGYPAGKRNVFHTNYAAEVTFPSNVYTNSGKLATETFVTSQGFLTSLPAHTHDDRYYTESESDARFATVSHTHDLMRYSLRAPANVDSMTSANFRTQMFGSSGSGFNISTARWNSVPSGLSGMNMYGTLLGWSGADTHGFIATDYSTANIQVGGGSGDSITWKATLIHSSNIGSQSVNYATSAGSATSATTAGNVTGTVAIANGGTGATTAAGARTNLGLGTAATSNTGDFATAGHSHSNATTGAAGFMSAADKSKLDGIASGATANSGTVTSVSGTGSYGGLTLSGTVTSSGSLTLGGTPSGTWPISISGNAATATNVAWTGVTGRPTALSQFSNDLGNYGGWITSSGSITGSARSLDSGNYISQRGSNGSWNADFQATPAGTLSYGGDLGSNGTNGPGGTWWVQQNFRHTNSSNYWGVQVAWGWEDNRAKLATRNVQGGNYDSWVYYLNSSNYTSYSPSLTGSGASGTWGINITGSAGSVAWTNVSSRPTNLSQFTNDLGNYGGWQSASTAITTSNIGSQSVNYATTAGTANAVAWGNVSGRPTAVSSFTNDSGYITSSGSISGTSRYVAHVDGPRDLSDRRPNWSARTAIFDFVGAGTGNGSGNYAGILTFVPWDGTSSSTGDSSYQLSFANQSGVNASGPARLSIRNGINSTWNSWQEILTSSNYNSYSPTLTGGNASGTWGINVTGSAGSVAWSNVSSRPTALSQFTNDLGNYGGWITSSGRAYPRRSDGGDLNFYWSGQSGQPTWLWGGTDGSNMYVYNPSNFSVNYAASAGSVAWSNVSGRPTNVSSFSNDSGYVTGGSSPTFTEVYANNWFRNNEPNEGLYNTSTTQHWSSRENGYWDASSTTTVSGIRFYTGGHVNSLRGYVYADSSNQIGFLNNAGSWSLRCDNAGNVTATGDLTAYSDARIKTNVATVENALDKVLQLRGVTYQRTDTEDKSTKVGLIAQEVKEVLPEVVTEQTDGLLSVSYGNMVGVLIEAMKEQQQIIETLEAKIELLTKYLK